METNKEKRKQIPLYSGLLKYFPDALCEVAKVSYVGSKQHHPNEPLHWDRNKSTDDLDALMRHLIDSGKTDTDGILHSAKVAWRALAHLQKEIENSINTSVTITPIIITKVNNIITNSYNQK